MHLVSFFITVLAALGGLAGPLAADKGSLTTETSLPALRIVREVLQARGSEGASSIVRRMPIPTVEEMKAHLKVSPGKVLLYSGPGGYLTKAREYIEREARRGGGVKGLKVLENSWKDPKFPAKFTGGDMKQLLPFWENASKAFAEMASGTVYILVPENIVGANFFPNTILARIEWPTLLKNPAVTKVVKVHPNSPKQEVIKGAGSAGMSGSR